MKAFGGSKSIPHQAFVMLSHFSVGINYCREESDTQNNVPRWCLHLVMHVVTTMTSAIIFQDSDGKQP